MALAAKKKEEAKKAEEGNAPAKKKEPEFDPNADLSKMSLPEQLAWNKMKMALNQKVKEEKIKKEKEEKEKQELEASQLQQS